MTLQILNALSEEGAEEIFGGGRPMAVNKAGQVRLNTSTPTMVQNSLLRKDEWKELDSQIMEAARHELRVVADIKSAGLTQGMSLGTLLSQWNVGTRMGTPTVSMTGQTVAERDRVEFTAAGVPVPVFSIEFQIGMRQLIAARKMGNALDFTHVYEATRSISEGLENMAMLGVPDLTFGGATIYGFLNHPNRTTETATNFGGGDWGTQTNIVDTIAGMVNAANANHHYGPFALYVSQTQYNEAALSFYTDGSGERPIDRIAKLGVASVRNLPTETLPAGQLALVQMTRNVVDWGEAMPIQALEWKAQDGMAVNFKVMTVATVRVKADSNGKVGVYHATGA